MTKFSRSILTVLTLFVLNCCSQVLENVQLELNSEDQTNQEEFKVIEKTLTLKEANINQSAPYFRRVAQQEKGIKSGHFDREDFLQSKLPVSEGIFEYRIGINDILQYSKLTENLESTNNPTSTFPKLIENFEYRLGVGDELELLRIDSQEIQSAPVLSGTDDNITKLKTEQIVISSSGRIGSDGSVLLLEVGKLEAFGKTLSELQSEVRNILIRNGLNPSFQLEIEKFASQRAYLTVNDKSYIVTLNDQKKDLREVLSSFGKGYGKSIESYIKLQRKNKSYSMTLKEVFSETTSSILILDGDHIFVQDAYSDLEVVEVVVGHDGNVVLPNIGNLNVVGLTIEEVKQKIINSNKGASDVSHNFQIEVKEFNSKKALINIPGVTGGVVPITNKPISLEEVVTELGLGVNDNEIQLITLKRGLKHYIFTLSHILNDEPSKLRLKANDSIIVQKLFYKPNKVFVLGGISPKIINIQPANRETLADVLFTNDGVLSSTSAKRSEVYLLRGTNPVIAYHLDAQIPPKFVEC